MTASEIARVFNAKKAGRDRWKARCTAHDDRSRDTLNIVAKEDRVLIICRAGCDIRDIIGSAGLRMRDLFYHSRDLASEALSRNQRRQRDQRAFNVRVGEWILRFLDQGYTRENRTADVAAVCACAIVLQNKSSAHWESILETHLARIMAAEHCRERGMLPETASA